MLAIDFSLFHNFEPLENKTKKDMLLFLLVFFLHKLILFLLSFQLNILVSDNVPKLQSH